TRLEPRTGAPQRFAAHCLATLVLPEGQVTAQGVRTGALSQRQPPRFTLAIIGGTGAYTTAPGQVRIVDLNATDSRLTLTLIRYGRPGRPGPVGWRPRRGGLLGVRPPSAVIWVALPAGRLSLLAVTRTMAARTSAICRAYPMPVHGGHPVTGDRPAGPA